MPRPNLTVRTNESVTRWAVPRLRYVTIQTLFPRYVSIPQLLIDPRLPKTLWSSRLYFNVLYTLGIQYTATAQHLVAKHFNYVNYLLLGP